MGDRLDEERIEILRGWGAGLAGDSREELRAAGKAITVLVDEIDRLQVDLWNARVDNRPPFEPVAASSKEIADTLQDRVAKAAFGASAGAHRISTISE
jgi:hypothetical protein